MGATVSTPAASYKDHGDSAPTLPAAGSAQPPKLTHDAELEPFITLEGSKNDDNGKNKNPQRSIRSWLEAVTLALLGLILTIVASFVAIVRDTFYEPCWPTSSYHHRRFTIAINPLFYGQIAWQNYEIGTIWTMVLMLVDLGNAMGILLCLQLLCQFMAIRTHGDVMWVGVCIKVPSAADCLRFASRICIVVAFEASSFWLLLGVLFRGAAVKPGSLLMVLGIFAWGAAAHLLVQCAHSPLAASDDYLCRGVMTAMRVCTAFVKHVRAFELEPHAVVAPMAEGEPTGNSPVQVV